MKSADGSKYSLILADTGFASTFFLGRHLQRSGPGARGPVLERGKREEHRDLIKRPVQESFSEGVRYFVNKDPRTHAASASFSVTPTTCTGNTPRVPGSPLPNRVAQLAIDEPARLLMALYQLHKARGRYAN